VWKHAFEEQNFHAGLISSGNFMSAEAVPAVTTRHKARASRRRNKEGKGQDDLDLASELPGALRWRNIAEKNGDVKASRASPGPILTNILIDTTRHYQGDQ
jgi:hypothetical protein